MSRRARLDRRAAGPPPPRRHAARRAVAARDATREPAGTTHFIVGDAHGNVVSMTATVESIFGTGRMVDGFFLNNQMTDFSFLPRDAQGRPAANAVAPGKRPRSSMTPAIILDREGRFVGAFGSPGGNAILAYVGKALVGVVDWGLPMQEAIASAQPGRARRQLRRRGRPFRAGRDRGACARAASRSVPARARIRACTA